jgi:pimeloyl-ACP methyl ester carboxylesterase
MGAMAGIRQYADGWWTSPDGLKLHYRDTPGDRKLLPILCLHGLSRNARDFGPMIEKIDASRRIIAVDIRGRGESADLPWRS